MATKISIKKGSMSSITVLVGFLVAVGADALAKSFNIDVPVLTQDQATIAITAGVAGLITGVMNWLKHRTKRDIKV